jgi:hypothetical protein
VNYQFSVHQTNCAGSTVVDGGSGSFNTGPNAISFLSLDAHNAGVSSLGWLIPVVAGIVVASLAGLGVLWRRRQL